MEPSPIADEPEKGHRAENLTSDEKFRAEYASIDPKEEVKLVRKLDLHIVPVVMLLYLLSFIDRYVLILSLPDISLLHLTRSQGQHRECTPLRSGRRLESQ